MNLDWAMSGQPWNSAVSATKPPSLPFLWLPRLFPFSSNFPNFPDLTAQTLRHRFNACLPVAGQHHSPGTTALNGAVLLKGNAGVRAAAIVPLAQPLAFAHGRRLHPDTVTAKPVWGKRSGKLALAVGS